VAETMLRKEAHPTYLSAYHEWLRDQYEKTTEQFGACRGLQADLIREFGQRLGNVTPASPEAQMLAAASIGNEALKMLRHRNGERGIGALQAFTPSAHQRKIIALLGNAGNGKDGKGHQDFEVTLAETAVAIALDVREEIGRGGDIASQQKERITELEDLLAVTEEAQIAAETVVADRDADNNSLRQENKEFGETITFLQERLEALEGKPAPESAPKKQGLLGRSAKDRDKRHKTATPGVTYREKADGSVSFSVLTHDGKWEGVGSDYDAAVERRVEILAEREAASV
jgi:hypothetical protein